MFRWIGRVMLALIAVLSAAIGAFWFYHRVPDRAYHAVECDEKRCWLKEGDGPVIADMKMYVGNNGWNVERTQTIMGAPWRDSRPVSFHKAWLEFDDKGQLHSPDQLKAILREIEKLKSDERSIFLIVFMHGWHHNASGKRLDGQPTVDPEDQKSREPNAVKADYFFARQAEQVRRLHEERRDGKAPAVLAVYVGWRGESNSAPWLNTLTIADRANVADTIGTSGELYSGLIQISTKLAEAAPDGRMLLAGHSLGGRALAMAFRRDVASDSIYPLGNNILVALIEPAIGAGCFKEIFATQNVTQRPRMISVASRDDAAIGFVYKVGSALPIWRISNCGDVTKGGTSIGHDELISTHELTFVRETQRGDREGEEEFVSIDWAAEKAFYKNSKATALNLTVPREPWYSKSGKRSLIYASHKGCDKDSSCPWRSSDFDIYTMRLHKGQAQNSRFWNVVTDRDTIDSEDNTFRASALHNFVSTNLARLYAEFLYQ